AADPPEADMIGRNVTRSHRMRDPLLVQTARRLPSGERAVCRTVELLVIKRRGEIPSRSQRRTKGSWALESSVPSGRKARLHTQSECRKRSEPSRETALAGKGLPWRSLRAAGGAAVGRRPRRRQGKEFMATVSGRRQL